MENNPSLSHELIYLERNWRVYFGVAVAVLVVVFIGVAITLLIIRR